MNRLSKLYEAYIFDLDGTVYLGDAFLPTAQETLQQLRALGKRTVFLSNNPTRTREAYADKLTRLGLPSSPEDVINSSFVMVQFLNKRMPGVTLHVVGEQSLIDELERGGFTISDKADEIDAVIASFDRTFDYWKLQVAFDAIRAGARFFATNADRYCPVPGGGEPDAAAMIAAIEACTHTTVEAVVGKPSHFMAEAILGVVGVSAQNCLMTGDRWETDVKMGLDAGMDAALTLTGATARTDLDHATVTPTYVIEQLGDLLPE